VRITFWRQVQAHVQAHRPSGAGHRDSPNAAPPSARSVSRRGPTRRRRRGRCCRRHQAMAWPLRVSGISRRWL